MRASPAIVVFALLLSACGLRDLQRESELADHAARLRGEVSSTVPGTVRVLLTEARPEGDALIQFADVDEQGGYTFYAFPGTYFVSAYVDQDGDGAYAPGEPAAIVSDDGVTPNPLVLAPGDHVKLPRLEVTGPLDDAAPLVRAEDLSLAMQNLGRVADLSEPLFSRENADLGMWEPIDFIANVGGGLMMLEPYDPDRTPVVFVHGLRGTATDFTPVLEFLDRERFQPWVLQYPSGLHLDVIATYLLRALNSLHENIGFERVMVVGHSMGGVVTRAFVLRVAERPPPWSVAFVATLAGPMRGMPSAAAGVALSPIVVPAWRDLDPNSAFIRDLHDAAWPEHVPWWLVFTYLPGEDSDGVVPIDHQLSPRLQDQAGAVFGVEASHVGVLSDPVLLERLAEQMAARDEAR